MKKYLGPDKDNSFRQTDKPYHITTTDKTCLTQVLKQTVHKAAKKPEGFSNRKVSFFSSTETIHFHRTTVFQLPVFTINISGGSWTYIHPSHVNHVVKPTLLLPIGVVNISLLTQAFTHSAGGARHSEISVWKLEGAVCIRLTGRLLGAGVIQVCQLQTSGHGDKLPGLEVQQGHGAQRRLGQEVEEPDQIQAHLGGAGDILSLFFLS